MSNTPPNSKPSNVNFDAIIDRRNSTATKWAKYAASDILPFWVADMDFPAPEHILNAVQQRLNHGILGYTDVPESLVEAFVTWMWRTYQWRIDPNWLVWISGVVPGLNLTARALAQPNGEILIPTPVYHPFLDVPKNAQQRGLEVPLVRNKGRWEMDLTAMERAISQHTQLLLLCNPQNPTGRAYHRAELEQLVTLCNKHDLFICSDEIHCALVLNGIHTPIASLDESLRERSVSLYAATKTYNIPGLACAVAVIPNDHLRNRFKQAKGGLVHGSGPLAFAATEAAFRDETPWLSQLLDYLRANHIAVADVAGERMTAVEATYLAWIDVRDAKLANPGAYFEKHGLGLSDGSQFGLPGFVRFNFAAPRALLERGLERLGNALESLNSPNE